MTELIKQSQVHGYLHKTWLDAFQLIGLMFKITACCCQSELNALFNGGRDLCS